MKRHPSRDSANQDRSSSNARRPLRLQLEPLEARRLLAGLNVSVFIDQDGSRGISAADSAASRRIVYVDLNGNNQQDASDPIAFTNERGVATFADLEPGEYAVGIVSTGQSQTQTFPVRVNDLATSIAPSATTLIANSDLSKVWTFDATGRGQLVSAAGTSTVPPVQLQGPIVASVVFGNEAWLITSTRGANQVTFSRMDLRSGRFAESSVNELNGRSIEKLVQAGSQTIAQLDGPQGIELASLNLVNGIPTLGATLSVPLLVAVAGSSTGELAIVQSPKAQDPSVLSAGSRLTIFSAADFAVQSSTSLPLGASEVAFSFGGQFVLAAFASGGVLAMQNSTNLPVVARLQEAASPLLANSKDGRFVTGKVSDSSEFIVWDLAQWQPTGRSRISVSSERPVVSADKFVGAVLAESGDQLVTTGADGTFVAQLAQATSVRASVPINGVGTAQLGVRSDRQNQPPSAAPVTAVGIEDSAFGGDLRSKATDVNGDTLWFSMLSAPANGRLELLPTGEWSYVPSSNFNGIDRAVVRVFDGQASSDVALVLDVTPVNDPPQDLEVELLTVAENIDAAQGTEFGYLTVFDADRGSRYRFETSDPRFVVRSGRIYLADGASLNYEAEPQIELEIFAIEDAVSGYQISTTATLTIADVNEPPTAVRILDAFLPENAEGAVIGQILVDDPEGASNFEFEVSDARFFVSGGYLMLKPGVELDYEEANSINLTVTAIDGTGNQTSEFPVSLTVADVNDPPTDIVVRLTTVDENSPGVIFGEVAVIDQDGDAYQYTVSDPRFEVVDGQIKLKDDQSLVRESDNALSLTVTATSLSGNSTISNAFTIAVGNGSPYQNPIEPRDVNGDGQITPVDALILINRLNSFGPGPLDGTGARGGSGEGPMWVDVNGDGVISPLDVLIIINWLNRRRLVAVNDTIAEGEGSSLATPPIVNELNPLGQPVLQPQVVNPFSSSDSSSKVASASLNAPSIFACPAVEFVDASQSKPQDDELELLLEQLSRQRLSQV